MSTKLHEAALKGDLAAVKKAGGSNVNVKNDRGQIPLHIACFEGHTDVVQYLIKKKTQINEQDNNGWTPFHCAVNGKNRETFVEICNLLLTSGADMTIPTSEGARAIHYLVKFVPKTEKKNDYQKLLKQVLEKDGCIFTRNNLGETPLHIAAMKKNLVALQFLFENGAVPDVSNNNGETALTYSVMGGSTETIQYLLDVGVNKYIFDSKDETARHLAKKMENREIIEALADNKLPALHTSIRNMKPNSVKIFVEGGQNLAQPDKRGVTPLHHSSTLPDLKIMTYLLEAKIDVCCIDLSGNSVLHYLAASRQMRSTNEKKQSEIDKILKILLQKGIGKVIGNVNQRNETALHLASLHGSIPLVKFLIENKADVNAPNIIGQTPLHYAVIGDQPEVVEILLEAHAEVKSSKHNDTPISIAKKLSYSYISTLLSSGQDIEEVISAKERRKLEKEREKQEKERRAKEEKERKREKKKEEKFKSKQLSKDVVISSPSSVRHGAHVGADLKWSEDLVDKFDFVEKVGEGAYGSVFKAVQKNSNYTIAIKILPAGDSPGDIEKEINILNRLRDPNIVSYLGSSVRDNQLWVMMEYCGAGSVSDIIKLLNKENRTLSENHVGAISVMVLKGLNYLHNQGIIHRDLKPANILLNGAGEAKIADFGVSAQLNATLQKAQTQIGTPLYMSPEVLNGSDYDFKFDIWSLGISVIEMAQGHLPFADCHVMRAIGLIVNGPSPKVDEPDKFSKEFNDFVAECLEKDPSKRKTADELYNRPTFIVKRKSQDNKKVMKEILSEFYEDLKSVDSSASNTPTQTLKSPLNVPDSPEINAKSMTLSKKTKSSTEMDPQFQIEFLRQRVVELEKLLSEARKENERLQALLNKKQEYNEIAPSGIFQFRGKENLTRVCF